MSHRTDDDEARLPENIVRIAYDADTEIYSYRDTSTNEIWEGEPGNRYGKLHRVVETDERYFSSDLLSPTVEDGATVLVDFDSWDPPPVYEEVAGRRRRGDGGRLSLSGAKRFIVRKFSKGEDGVRSSGGGCEDEDVGARDAVVDSPVEVETTEAKCEDKLKEDG